MAPDATTPSPARRWLGRILSALPVLLLLFSASMKLHPPAEVVAGFVKSGYAAGSLLPIGITELACTLVYLIPQTSIFGAILLTGYLGGAVSTHVRASESFILPILTAVFLWAGLYLRDPRLRALLPLRWKTRAANPMQPLAAEAR